MRAVGTAAAPSALSETFWWILPDKDLKDQTVINKPMDSAWELCLLFPAHYYLLICHPTHLSSRLFEHLNFSFWKSTNSAGNDRFECPVFDSGWQLELILVNRAKNGILCLLSKNFPQNAVTGWRVQITVWWRRPTTANAFPHNRGVLVVIHALPIYSLDNDPGAFVEESCRDLRRNWMVCATQCRHTKGDPKKS